MTDYSSKHQLLDELTDILQREDDRDNAIVFMERLYRSLHAGLDAVEMHIIIHPLVSGPIRYFVVRGRAPVICREKTPPDPLPDFSMWRTIGRCDFRGKPGFSFMSGTFAKRSTAFSYIKFISRKSPEALDLALDAEWNTTIRMAVLTLTALTGYDELTDLKKNHRQEVAIKETLLESIEEGVIMTNEDYKVTYANKRFYELTGLRPEGTLDKPVRSFLNVHLPGADSQPVFYETTLPRQDGSFWLAQVRVTTYPDNEKTGLIISFTDRTEWHRTQRETERRKHFLNLVLNTLPIVLSLKNEQGEYVFVNKHLAETLGESSTGRFIGKQSKDFFIAETALQIEANDRRAFGQNRLFSFEEKTRLNDREYVWFSGKTTVPDPNSDQSLLLTFSIDITERKNAERRLNEQKNFIQNIIDTNPNLVFVKDTDGRFILANKAFAQSVDMAVEDILGRRDSELNIESRERINAYASEDAHVLAYQETITREEKIEERGRGVNYSYTIKSPLTMPGGATYVLGVTTDVTKLKEVQQQLEDARKQAEEAKNIKDMFFANMSHEIRTPLNSITGFVNLLLDSPLNGEQRRYLEAIHLSTQNLLVIVNDILDYSKLEAGMLRLEQTEFSVSDQINSVKEMYRLRAKEKDIKLTTSVDLKTPNLNVQGDPVRLHQILINLVGNSLKFTNAGQIHLSVQEYWQDDTYIELLFEVRDTGIGIPPDKLNFIFDRFTQADESVTRKFGGTGLGLSICRQLVEIQDGFIEAESYESQETVFRFMIPYKKSQATGLSLTRQLPNDEEVVRLLNGHKILLVEDNPINQMLAMAILRKWKVSYDVAENGAIAIEKLQKETYSLVLMDLQMPVMDGVEATTLLRQDAKTADLLIVAFTADIGAKHKDNFEEARFDSFLTKPFSPTQLFNTLVDLLKINVETPDTSSLSTDIISSLSPLTTQTEQKMTSSSADNKLTDLSYLYEFGDNDTDFVKEMIEIFITQVEEEFPVINQHIAALRLQEARRLLHKIKPSVGFMGMSSTAKEIAECEKMDDTRQTELQQATKKIEATCQRAVVELRPVYEGL